MSYFCFYVGKYHLIDIFEPYALGQIDMSILQEIEEKRSKIFMNKKREIDEWYRIEDRVYRPCYKVVLGKLIKPIKLKTD